MGKVDCVRWPGCEVWLWAKRGGVLLADEVTRLRGAPQGQPRAPPPLRHMEFLHNTRMMMDSERIGECVRMSVGKRLTI
jgi:hypothetical protein